MMKAAFVERWEQGRHGDDRPRRRPFAHRDLTRLAVFVLGAAFAGCRDKPENAAIQATYDNAGLLRMLTYDSNSNGKPDTWSYMEGPRIVRIEIDADEDGAIDRWEYYDSDQKLVKVGTARKRDGKIARTEFYEGGVLARAEEDTDGNVNVDKWEIYANGVVASVAFDTDGAGHPTRRIQYDPAPGVQKR